MLVQHAIRQMYIESHQKKEDKILQIQNALPNHANIWNTSYGKGCLLTTNIFTEVPLMVWLLPRPCWGSGGARLPPRPPPPPPPLPSSLADQSLIILAICCQCPSPRHWSRAKKAPGAICTHGWWVLPRVDLWHLTTHNLNNLLSQLKPQQMKFQFNRFFNKFFCSGYLGPALKMLSWQPPLPFIACLLATLDPPSKTHSFTGYILSWG